MLDKNTANYNINQIKELTLKLITKYRDLFLIERDNILKEYINNFDSQSELYFVYDINSKQNDTFNIVIYSINYQTNILEINQKELPRKYLYR